MFFMTAHNDLWEILCLAITVGAKLWIPPIGLYDRREPTWGIPIVLYDPASRSRESSNDDRSALARDVFGLGA